MSSGLDGSVVVVSGGGGGIGTAVVADLRRHGARVAMLDVQEGDADLSVRVDVTSDAEVRRACATVRDRLGPVTHAVAAAGIVSEAPLDALDPDIWHRTIDVSLTGTYHLARALLPAMAGRGGGALVAFSSGYATSGYRHGGHYAAAKAGVEALVKSLASEFGPAGVRVNAVAPGPVLTPMIDHIDDREQWRRDRETRIPLGRVATPDDIVGPVRFLLGDDSGYVTGQVLHVNGGLLMP